MFMYWHRKTANKNNNQLIGFIRTWIVPKFTHQVPKNYFLVQLTSQPVFIQFYLVSSYKWEKFELNNLWWVKFMN